MSIKIYSITTNSAYLLISLQNSKHDEPNLEHIFADAGYRGKLTKWVKEKLKMNMIIVKLNPHNG